MNVTFSKKYLFAAAALFLLIFMTGVSEAASLADIRDEIASYQLEPLKRARHLANDLHKLRGLEEGLARQYDVPVSQIIGYEYELAGLINAYYSIYFMQKYLETNDSFTLDDARLNQIASVKPPYSLSFYLDVMEDMDNCSSMLNLFQENIDYSKDALLKLDENKKKVEREYRLFRDKSTLSTERRLKFNFLLLITKAKLERCYADATYHENNIKTSQVEVAGLNEKIVKLTPLIKAIRENLVFESEDYEALDAKAYAKIKFLRDTITGLNDKYDELDRVRRTNMERDSFAKYWSTTEEKLVASEILLALDIMELWNAASFAWHLMEDAFVKELSVKSLVELKEQTESFAIKCRDARVTAQEEMRMLQRVNEEVLKRFGEDSFLTETEDVSRRNDFRVNIDRRIDRYLSYMTMLREMSELFSILSSELKGGDGDTGPTVSIGNIAHYNIENILDTEIWSVGDYPITAGKLIAAAVILLVGTVLTLIFVRFVKRHISKKEKVSSNGSMLLQNMIFCLGVISSFLVALKVLHIPLTAFAFMGGAAAIAVGLGTQKIMGDTLAGILLLFQKKLRIGDEVIIGDKRGIVSEMSLQNTALLCEQSRMMIIPNSKVLENSVINLTLNNSLIRTEVSVSIAYSSDVQAALSLIRSALIDNPDVLKTPPFRINLSEFEDSAVKFTVYFFVDLGKVIFEANVQSSVRMDILKSFREHGIEIPFPQTEVTLKNDQ